MNVKTERYRPARFMLNAYIITGKHSPRRSRSRLPRWLRPHSCGNLSDPSAMSEEGRAERVARYKEERRRQLAAQFHNDASKRNKDNSSSSEGPRTTRASRLRTAVQGGGSTPRINHAEVNFLMDIVTVSVLLQT